MRADHSAGATAEATQEQRPGSVVVRDPRWAAVLKRDRGADETFWYSVKTTGVFCRPSCGARTPRPENVAFHESRAQALRAGFRPCKRCKPDQQPLPVRQAAFVAELCRYIEQCEQPPSLEQLAQRAGLSESHLHRVFKAATGLTPKAYAQAQRARRVRVELAAAGPVTRAIYDPGYIHHAS